MPLRSNVGMLVTLGVTTLWFEADVTIEFTQKPKYQPQHAYVTSG